MKCNILHFLLFTAVIFNFSAVNTFAESEKRNNQEHDHEGEEHLHDSEDLDLHSLDSRYYHDHEGHPGHDLSMAYVAFKSDPIDSVAEITGRWELERFETTDLQMKQMLQGSGYDIRLDVTEDYLQVTVRIHQSGKEYQDPPLHFTVTDGVLSMENRDFSIGYKNGRIVLGMLGMDEAYRYTFIR